MWSAEEITELKEHFKDYLELKTTKKCPGQKDCLHAIPSSKIRKGLIWKRNWETIKKKVSNMMATAKKIKQS